MGKSKMKNKKVPHGLGAALVKGQRRAKAATRQQRKNGEETIGELGFESVGGTKKSVTETNDLESFLADAVMAGRTFAAHRESRVIELSNEAAEGQVGSASAPAPSAIAARLGGEPDDESTPTFDFRSLPIPRRPPWTRDMTAAELDLREKEAFMAWRRGIAKLEASNPGLQSSPFEKNLDYWRQLWRVVERSELVVQVVDARNPLLFRCPDVEAFTEETGAHKMSLLLINKADFLTPELRTAWRDYFVKHGISFVYFSAKLEQKRLDAGEPDPALHRLKVEAREREATPGTETVEDIVHSTDELLSRMELLEVLERLAAAIRRRAASTEPGLAEPSEEHAGEAAQNAHKASVGMIGYPNVGKSSVINVLFGVTATDHTSARVSVAATPGHTKHFQTLHLSDGTILCDCPGLVFPTFMSTKADLLCNGILPIDEIRGRDFFPAIQIVARCIPRSVFEETYVMQLPLVPGIKRVPADMLIESYCEKRGLFGSGHGRYHESHGARILLKDFVNGKLCYCCSPPVDPDHGSAAAPMVSVGGLDPHAGLVEEGAEQGEIDPTEEFGLEVVAEAAAALTTRVAPDAEVTEEDLALLLDDEQLLYTESIKIDKALAKKEKMSQMSGKKPRSGRGYKNRHADPYGSGDYFEAHVKGRTAAQPFTRVERPWAPT